MSNILSICIPSFDRVDGLNALLHSIDVLASDVEIVISEDFSPRRSDIASLVEEFRKHSSYRVKYVENFKNLGFDGNLRRLIAEASGKYVLFMGDDDLFIPGALQQYINFLKNHIGISYILRSYQVTHESGKIEDFKYLSATAILPPGEKTVGWLFKRSVTISGFTIDLESAKKYATDKLDGTLLYHVYLMAKVCLREASIFCDIPVAKVAQSYRSDSPKFGSSDAEIGRYTPGTVSDDNSINFTKSYFEVARYIDLSEGTNLEKVIRVSLSRNSYPFLSIQRKRGIRKFLSYSKRLELECGLSVSRLFFVYKWALVFFGEKNCDRGILAIKRYLGFTPNL